jgi:hypothetical protein
MLHFNCVRPVLILFVMSGLGFVVILHKQDAPEVKNSKPKASELPKVSKHNWMKGPFEMTQSVAKTAGAQRQENEGP